MSKHNFDIEKLKQRDDREWNNVYIKLRGMLQSKAYTKRDSFNEDVFQEASVILFGKISEMNGTKDIVNFFFATYRNHLNSFFTQESKFNKRKFITTEDGFEILTPDLVGCDINDVDIQENAEQLQEDLDALKRKFEEIKLKSNKGNQIKNINLFEFFQFYLVEPQITLEDLCLKFGLKNPQYMHNMLVLVQKHMGLDKPFKKASKPLEEILKKKAKTSAEYRKRTKLKKEQE